MAIAPLSSTTHLISAKAASDLVPYSRDYIARIAREGKIAAVQIDRQWFVEETSLQNFYTQSLIEEAVRKRHLSHKRKLELEVKERYQSRLKQLEEKRRAGAVATAIVATLVLFGGMSSGVWFLSGDSSIYLASLATSEKDAVANRGLATSPYIKSTEYFVESPVVLESTRNLSFGNGVVLLPTGSSDQELEDTRDLFSDEAVISVTSSTTGIIEVKQAGVITTMPFVRIPNQGVNVVNEELDGNEVSS